jgi:NTE family protein
MEIDLEMLRSRRIGLALGGGGPRGIAHISVLRVLREAGIEPSVIAGTSVGSLVGAGIAAGKNCDQLTEMARAIFWPSLLNARKIEAFCRKYLPETFDQLVLPYAAVAVEIPSMKQIIITEGNLATAISASCAIPLVRLPVTRDGMRLWDGGLRCVLPTEVCRDLGAELVISSDVWELGNIMRRLENLPGHEIRKSPFVANYKKSLQATDLLITSNIPLSCFIPGQAAVDRLLKEGEIAARAALANIEKKDEKNI